jgi:cytochrome b561
MQWRNSSSRYGFVASSLHWIIVAAIIAQYFLAEAAEEQRDGSASVFSAASIHNSIGIAVLALALLRILWRVVETPPEMPTTMQRYEIVLARTVHIAFYVLLFAIPLSGWALATADEQPLSFFGLFDIPQLRIGAQLPVTGGALSEDQLEEIHEILFNVLLGLALLHMAAALKHHFFDHDGVLRSMLPWRKREQV